VVALYDVLSAPGQCHATDMGTDVAGGIDSSPSGTPISVSTDRQVYFEAARMGVRKKNIFLGSWNYETGTFGHT